MTTKPIPAEMPLSDPAPLSVARRFLGVGTDLTVVPLGEGLINDTFRVDAPAGRRVLQRINTAVFPAPDGIMANLGRLQAAIDAMPRDGLRLPRIIPAQNGALLVRDRDGGCWRLLEHIAGSRTLRRIANIAQARETGRMLGRFHRVAARLDPDGLAVTLPGFHDTPAYLDQLQTALRSATVDDPRVAAAAALIEARQQAVHVLSEARNDGRLPLRVTHGDPKLDNVLFAADADRALCLIDLDTVQPGLVHHDIGDCLRSCCNRRGELGDGSVHFDLDLCRAILEGYSEAGAGLLGADEIPLLYPAIRLLPLELAIRFLTDHLDGDRWFRVRARGENLAKAKIQLALVTDIEAKQEPLRQIIDDCFGAAGR